jgi:predicted 3-demethylubiquinone-9 3-methyltransferase (glyoxalase superfamily)
MQRKITPFLWFDGNAEEAANFYVSVFPDARITARSYYGDAGPGPQGALMTITFELDGQEFVGLNGGPQYRFTPAVSFFIECEDQAEIDRYWEKLVDGGRPVACGWVTDRFGLSWQVVPAALLAMLQDADRARAQRVMSAMLQMVKLDLSALQRAWDGA